MTLPVNCTPALCDNPMLPSCCQVVVYPLACALLIISVVAVAGAFPNPVAFGGLTLGLGGVALTGRLFKILSSDHQTQHPSISHEILFLIGSIALLILGFVGLTGAMSTVHLGGIILGSVGGLGVALIAKAVWERRRVHPPARLTPPQRGAQHKPPRRPPSPEPAAQQPLPPPQQGTQHTHPRRSPSPTWEQLIDPALLQEALRDTLAPVPTERRERALTRDEEQRLEEQIIQKRTLLLSCRNVLDNPASRPQWIAQVPPDYASQLKGERLNLPQNPSHSLRVRGSTTWLSQPYLSQENRQLFRRWVEQRTELTPEQLNGIRTDLLNSLSRLTQFSNLCLPRETLNRVRQLIPLICGDLQTQRDNPTYNPTLRSQHKDIEQTFNPLIDTLTGTLFAPLDLPSMGGLFSVSNNNPTLVASANNLRALRAMTPFRLSPTSAAQIILAITYNRIIPQKDFQRIKQELP